MTVAYTLLIVTLASLLVCVEVLKDRDVLGLLLFADLARDHIACVVKQ